MKIRNVKSMTLQDIEKELGYGGKFVVYHYCISIFVMTFFQSSDIYFLRPGDRAWPRGFVFSLLTLIMGWWGVPWGPIYSWSSLASNLKGGKDVTKEVLDFIKARANSKRFVLTD